MERSASLVDTTRPPTRYGTPPLYTAIVGLTDAQTEQLKVMFRFPPDALVPYLLREWAFYRPLRVFMAQMLEMGEVADRMRYLLFPGLYKPLESGDFSDMLRKSTMTHLGYEIGLHDWRQIESNFVQTFWEGAIQGSLEPAHFGQRGQSVKTGVRHYNRTREYPNGVALQVIKDHLESSEFWQDLTGMSLLSWFFHSTLIPGGLAGIQKLPVSEPGPHDNSESLFRQAVELYKRISEMLEDMRAIQKAIPATVQRTAVLLRPNFPTPSASDDPPPHNEVTICPHPSNLARLRRFMGDQRAQFTRPEQAQALEAVLGGSDHVFLIGPTGMGKTSVFLIPAKESPHKVTIVLIPLSALRVDFSRRCARHDITWTEWTEANQSERTIVMVSPENAAKRSFLSWARNLKLRGVLLRFVYDEVHMRKMHESFRNCFSSHRRLIEMGE